MSGAGGLTKSVAAGQTYSGAITSLLGEIRADTSNATTGFNPYATVTSFTINNGLLQIVASSTASAVQNRMEDTTPIFLNTGRIRLENASF